MTLLKSPKVASTRLQLPLGVAGSEPARAEPGTLAYDTVNDEVRVQTAFGWRSLGYSFGELWQYPNGFVRTNFPGSYFEEFEDNTDVTLALPSPFQLWKEGGPFTVQTANIAPGNIDLYNTTFTGGQPRFASSNWRTSNAVLQVPYDGTAYYLMRPVTLNAEAFFWTRIGGDVRSQSRFYGPGDDLNGQLSLHLLVDDGSARPGYGSQVYVSQFYRNTGAGIPGWYYVFAGTDAGTPRGAEASLTGTDQFYVPLTVAGPKYDYFGIQKIGTTYHGLLGNDDGQTIYMGSFTVSAALGFAGFGVRERTDPGTTWTPVHTCDFLRLITGPNATASFGFGQ